MKNTFALENDLLLFFTVLKIFLDDIAFLLPFYFKEPIRVGAKKPDMRDMERPKDFRSLKKFFYDNEDIDNEFVDILKANEEWTDELCDIRKFLMHRFHDLSINNDWWTQSYYGLLYEFNDIKRFIPDILAYVAKIYYRFVRFTKGIEKHFKNRCQEQFPDFEYFGSGRPFANSLDKTHLFFAGLGKLLENKIIIRVQGEKFRRQIPKILEHFMREEKVVCNSCDKFKFQIKPTVEHYVVISSHCNCGGPLPIPLSVERKFYPHFMDQNTGKIAERLIPYELKIKILKVINARG